MVGIIVLLVIVSGTFGYLYVKKIGRVQVMSVSSIDNPVQDLNSWTDMQKSVALNPVVTDPKSFDTLEALAQELNLHVDDLMEASIDEFNALLEKSKISLECKLTLRRLWRAQLAAQPQEQDH